ncbi:PREDICTED: F-box protein At3g57590-like [Camelina sativa]|uniref:F-box protein At3g57590-like n=1 Tax=Camelina sativa TaxID=90675 RepID=A0ABM0X532_CAMSA|nr:PREDICTED: F-box protein At3g57590-like [Camelina sativa]
MVSQRNKHSSNPMKRGENLGLIPTDLIMEIFSRLPAKSVARFRTLSKLWGSMLHLPYFTQLFLTKSSARPRLLFAIKRCSEWLFLSSPQPQNPYDKSSLVLAANFHRKFVGRITSHASSSDGLIIFPDVCKLGEAVRVICNPTTGKYATLPKLSMMTSRESTDLFGFDPIDKQYKVLIMGYVTFDETVHYILTLGTGHMRWRRIQCPISHHVCSTGICINGDLYYLADKMDEKSHGKTNLLVCFDVRSEKFKFVDAEFAYDNWRTTLINYKGKLGVINWNYDDAHVIELSMWVLEDMEKHEWSEYIYTLPENKDLDVDDITIAGVTATGEIVFSSLNSTCKPFYVIYYNPEKNTLQNIVVEIQGFEAYHECKVYTFVDYVEDLSVNDAKQLRSSIYARSVKKKRSLNSITERSKPQHREEVRGRDDRHKRQ